MSNVASQNSDEHLEASRRSGMAGVVTQTRKRVRSFSDHARVSSHVRDVASTQETVVKYFATTGSVITISPDYILVDQPDIRASVDRNIPDWKNAASREKERKRAEAEATKRRYEQKERSELRFVKLMEMLLQNDRAGKAVLVWVLSANWGQKGSRGMNALRDLQDCLARAAGTDDGVRSWLHARSAFIIDQPGDGWAEKTIAGADHDMSRFGSIKPTATDFFQTLAMRPWRDFASVTAFVKPDGENADNLSIDYWAHRRHGDSNHASRISSYSLKRDRFTRYFYNAARASIEGRVDEKVISKLFGAGFLIFSFEEFFRINK